MMLTDLKWSHPSFHNDKKTQNRTESTTFFYYCISKNSSSTISNWGDLCRAFEIIPQAEDELWTVLKVYITSGSHLQSTL